MKSGKGASLVFDFLKSKIVWWITPLIILVVNIILLLILGKNNPDAPFIYALG